jgi:hypothetical protein
MTAAPKDELVTHLAQGEASWMLLECLMMALIDRGLIPRDEMLTMVETVISTKQQMIADHEHPHIAAVAVGLLSRLSNSLAAHKD